jgi:hypothetical protein
MLQVETIDPIDAPGRPQIEVQTNGYRVTIPDRNAGDFVYFATKADRGLACEVIKVDSISCSAIVADAIVAEAGSGPDDSPSLGLPHVQKVSDTAYTGGVTNSDVGELAYRVTTNGSADHCTVTSVQAAAPNAK